MLKFFLIKLPIILPQNKPSQSPHKSLFFCSSQSPPPSTHFNPMSRRVLCKFFARGACLKGECCEFSHDWKAPPNNICTYYQKGACAYGSRCKFNHIIDPHSESCASFSSRFCEPPLPGFAASDTPVALTIGTRKGPCSPITGSCLRGEKCPHIHGDLCSICGKNCLHPFRPEESEEHKRSCERRQKHLDALKHSQEIECSVCLERVLSKPTSAERKFGLLSECDHPFCISCIRNWRSNSPSSGMDINSALRACPICRKLSYFVVPSVIWYFSKEEKQEIIYNYKSKLKSIDCKYFDFGSGSCPFGDSCFYKHAYHDGRLEEEVPNHVEAADGNTIIAKERLPDFLSGLHIR